MSKLTEILSHLKKPVSFEPVLKVKPYAEMVRIYGLEKTNAGEVMVQINDGSFHRLEEKDKNYDLVADEILNRLHEPIQS